MHEIGRWIISFLVIALSREKACLGQAYVHRDRTNDIMRLNLPHQPINTNTICGNTDGLTRRQYQLCKQDPNAVASAIQGMQRAIYECKRQFKDHRWNCTSLETKNKIPHTSAFFKRGFREAAFSHAIASAGVAHAVAYACSLGKIEGCGCEAKRHDFYKNTLSAAQHKNALKNNGNISQMDPDIANYLWGGCDHNINFGIKFSRKFLDERQPAHDHHTQSMLHNNRVGRLIVGNNMSRRCTCHGTSGSCSLQTCWKQTPDIGLVGAAIKKLYHKARKIEPTNTVEGYHFDFNKELTSQLDNNLVYPETRNFHLKQKQSLGMDVNNLIYFEDSPDYCEDDKSIGFGGTRGRYCNRTAVENSTSSCSNLCCHRGYRTYKQTRVEKCHCRFHWCCYVICSNCTITERVAVCR